MHKRNYLLTWLFSNLLVVVLGFASMAEVQPDYSGYQREFAAIVDEMFGPEKAALAPRGVQQIWIESANRVDRCTTCHLGITWAGLEDVEQPFTTHPLQPLERHPVEKFGCSFCHGGQGYSTGLPEAHGWVKHWDDPLIDSRLAEEYGLQDPSGFLEMRCNQCHRYDRETAGMDRINEAKQLVNEKGCRACHTINGRGGTIGPDLTNVGEKGSEQYDYSRLNSFPSVLNWHIAHLQVPKNFTPDTVMPEFGFDSNQARNIALLLLTWRDMDLPPELLPGAVLKDIPTAEEAERERMMLEGDGRFFVEKACFICHDVSSFGIESATKIGPDLAIALEDAPKRFGRTLEDFLHNPSGTMQVVLTRQIKLSPEEVDEAVRLLTIANQRLKEQQAEAVDSVPGSESPKLSEE